MKYKTECEFEPHMPKIRPQIAAKYYFTKGKAIGIRIPTQVNILYKHTVATPFSDKQITHTLGKTAPIITDADPYQALPSLPISG